LVFMGEKSPKSRTAVEFERYLFFAGFRISPHHSSPHVY
jgi:hypothetical protein